MRCNNDMYFRPAGRDLNDDMYFRPAGRDLNDDMYFRPAGRDLLSKRPLHEHLSKAAWTMYVAHVVCGQGSLRYGFQFMFE